MRQLITRMPDELHEQLTLHARARGQSVNELVVGVLTAVVGGPASRSGVRELLAARGLLVVPRVAAQPPSHAELDARNAGSGPALSQALAAERGASR